MCMSRFMSKSMATRPSAWQRRRRASSSEAVSGGGAGAAATGGGAAAGGTAKLGVTTMAGRKVALAREVSGAGAAVGEVLGDFPVVMVRNGQSAHCPIGVRPAYTTF